MSKFRKKPVVIEAVQYPCAHPALKRCDCDPDQSKYGEGPAPPQACSECGHEFIETLEGRMRVSAGDWIITGVQGEHYPCKPDIFAATYEPASAPQPPSGGEVRCPECDGAGGRRWHEADGSERGERCGTCDGFGHVTAPPSAPVGVECNCPGEGKTDPSLHAPNCPVRLAQQPAAVFRNDGNSEADFIAHEANACTACGGSGHKDDQQPAAVDGAVELLREIRDLLWSLPKDCMGSDTDASGQPYPIRDEVIDSITKQIAAQPGGSDNGR